MTKPNYSVLDNTTGETLAYSGDTYSGPVGGLNNDFIIVNSDNINIDGNLADSYISIIGTGMDSINTSGTTGGCLLDSSYAMCFLTGTSAQSALQPDTFYINADSAKNANAWSTIVNFHQGDSLTIWDWTGTSFANMTWLPGQGADGYKGLTGVYTSANGSTVGFTLAGTEGAVPGSDLSFAYGQTTGASATDVGRSYLTITHL